MQEALTCVQNGENVERWQHELESDELAMVRTDILGDGSCESD